MRLSFLQHLKDRLPPAYKAEFERQLLLSSLYNIRLLSWVGFAFFFPLFLLDYMRVYTGTWSHSSLSLWIALSHLVLIALVVPALMAQRYLKILKSDHYLPGMAHFTRIFPIAIALLLLPNFVFGMMTRGNIVFYAIFILCISVAVLLPHKRRLLFNIGIFVVMLLIALILFWPSVETIFLLTIEITGVSLPAFLIATYQFNLRAQEFVTRKALHEATERSEQLLLNILPESVAAELKAEGQYRPRLFRNVSILFADFKDFTLIAQQMSAAELVHELHTCFSHFDGLMAEFGMEKIKTIGDAYMCVSGLPEENEEHALRAVQTGLAMQDYLEKRRKTLETQGKQGFQARIGIHSGAVMAGVVGTRKYAYDIWGNSVNIAARCQEAAEVDSVNLSKQSFAMVEKHFTCVPRGKIQVKNLGQIEMYRVLGTVN